MIRGGARSWPRLLRALIVLALMFGLAIQPVLASIGELHELAHDPAGSHGYVDGDASATALVADQSDSAETLHTLLEFAHCCGQSTTSAPSALIWPEQYAPALTLPIVEAQTVPGAHALAPFRPPIVM